MEEKICSDCNVLKNIIFYKIENYIKKKYNDVCIDCSNEVRECTECKITKKLYNFKLINKQKKTYNLLCDECFEIVKKQKKEKQLEEKKIKQKNRYIKRYAEKREQILESNKKWRDNNKEYRSIKDKEYRNKPEIKEQLKQYHEKKREVKKIYLKNYYRQHKDAKKTYDKLYRIKNKDKIRLRLLMNKDVRRQKYIIYRFKNAARLKLKRKINYKEKINNPKYLLSISTPKHVLRRKLQSKINDKYIVSVKINDLIDLWNKQEGKCYLTGIKMDNISYSRSLKNVSIDQIEAGKGYTIDNIALCCESINMAKMQMSKNDFIKQLKLAGENIKNKLYENIDKLDLPEINNDCKKYLLTLFNNKKIKNKIGVENIINLWKKQNGKCAITGIDMTYEKNSNIKFRNPTNISVDKINPKLGYTLDNIHLTCLWANTGKLIYSLEEFQNLLLEGFNNINY